MRLGARFAIFSLLLGASSWACNAITGAKERQKDPGLESIPDRDSGDDDEDTGANNVLDGSSKDTSVVDTGVDTGPIVITIDTKNGWTTYNGGFPTYVANGVKIGSMDASAANNHPIIVPNPQPNITSENYTVRATIRAPAALAQIPEFGIALRFQSNKSLLVMGNVYGASPPPFMGDMQSTGSGAWNPTKSSSGKSYTYTPSAQYKFMARVVGTEARAKFWIATDAEPATEDILYASPFGSGTGVGFYTYTLHDAVLEEMTVTIP